MIRICFLSIAEMPTHLLSRRVKRKRVPYVLPVRVRFRTVEQQSYADVTSLHGPFQPARECMVGSDAVGLRSRLLRPVRPEAPTLKVAVY